MISLMNEMAIWTQHFKLDPMPFMYNYYSAQYNCPQEKGRDIPPFWRYIPQAKGNNLFFCFVLFLR
jgi:hypothetical protein